MTTKVVFDIECNSLVNPSNIWLVAAKEIDTGELHVYRDVQGQDRDRFLAFWRTVGTYIGHNWLEYDYPVIRRLLGTDFELREVASVSVDTLVLSRLADYSRQGTDSVGEVPAVVAAKSRHSVAAYGLQFGYPKLEFTDFSQYSPAMEEYCVRDVEITEKIYRLHQKYAETYWPALEMEQQFQFEVCNKLHERGFAFNKPKAEKLLTKVTEELGELDAKLHDTFKPKSKLIREVHPKLTKYQTLHRGDFRWVQGGDLSEFNGGPFSRFTWETFNPSSHKQVIEVLYGAGWHPTEKTQSHIEFDRSRQKDIDKATHLGIYGWKINETNLSTLPSGAPEPARLLAKRILLESRRRTLTEWLSLVTADGRIHGRFFGIGAWTHRMAHQAPNTANIPNEFDTQGKKKLLGKELRSLWIAPKKRLLCGVDAEGIQLRIFAHLIDDKEFTDALVCGRKDDKTDPHSLNQRVLGSVCKSRAAAKRFIYALLLGARLRKLSEVLDCTEAQCREALDRLLRRYTGFQRLKESIIPKDAQRGYFLGVDGRKISIPGQTRSEREHLAMSGYLQSGEAIVVKRAAITAVKAIEELDSFYVDIVHDEIQTETPNNIKIALQVAEIKAKALEAAGEFYKLKCPMKGSYWNEDARDYTIGTNWSVTH